jgi:hypothetical protein
MTHLEKLTKNKQRLLDLSEKLYVNNETSLIRVVEGKTICPLKSDELLKHLAQLFIIQMMQKRDETLVKTGYSLN